MIIPEKIKIIKKNQKFYQLRNYPSILVFNHLICYGKEGYFFFNPRPGKIVKEKNLYKIMPGNSFLYFLLLEKEEEEAKNKLIFDDVLTLDYCLVNNLLIVESILFKLSIYIPNKKAVFINKTKKYEIEIIL